MVPSHNRPLRLRWLLNGLEDQTLRPGEFEVIVVDDSSTDEAERVLRDHPLAATGVLRWQRMPPSPKSASRLRNVGWRLARAPLVAFTDDDCRPPADWLERLVDAADRHPGAIVQGMTLPDPDEEGIRRHAPYARSQEIVPPVPWAQTCNILYPRALIERVGGFREDPPLETGEDTDLAERARATGAGYHGSADAVTFHAVDDLPLHRRLRGLWRWQDLPLLLKLHPRLRGEFVLWLFWKRRHVWFLPAVTGALLWRRRPGLGTLLAVPYVVHALPRHGHDPRGRFRELAELPAAAAIDATEVVAVVWGSVKHRSLLV